MLVFVAFVQGFIGTLVWLLLSEIFPMAIRGFAMGIAVFVLWCVNALISFVFPILVEAAGATVTFGLFVLINMILLRSNLRPTKGHRPAGDRRGQPSLTLICLIWVNDSSAPSRENSRPIPLAL